MFSISGRLIAKGHEQIGFFQDPASGVAGIVAIHNTVLGPALGGCRMNRYANLEDALLDVLRLSEGMTYKSSLAGLDLGGGKAVLVADRSLAAGRKELFESFGRFIAGFGGRYYTAEDMGTTVADVSAMMTTCPFVAGKDTAVGGGGDPSPYTALGVFEGMRACLERVFGSDDFKGKHVALQGVGNVGRRLAKQLAEAGANLTLSDSRKDVAAALCKELGAKEAAPDAIMTTECDIFAPCATGGTLTPDTAKKLRTKIVAGAANNQILGAGAEEALGKAGIVYAPDFAINAGGVILCADELEPGGFNEARVTERVKRIYQTVGRVLDEAKKSKQPAGAVAVRLANDRIIAARRAKPGAR